MGQALVIEGGHEYAAGLITAAPKNFLPLGASPVLQNVDFSRYGDCIAKRKGIAVNQAEKTGTGFSSVSGLYEYVRSSGAKNLLASAGNNVYDVSGGVWTSKYAGAMAGADTNFTTFKDLMVMVASTEATQKWDGVAGAFAVLLGTPPANGKYGTVWKSRGWIANTSAGKSRLHFSAANNIEDWVTANDAGFIDVNPDDGDQITGLMSAGLVLVVFKTNSVYMIYGSTPSTYELRQVSVNSGCASHRSIAQIGPYIVYLSQYGINSINGSNVQGVISPNIRFDIEGLSSAVRTGACGGRLRNLYVLAFDSNGDGVNDAAWTIDVFDGTVSYWTNVNARVMAQKIDGTLLLGGSDKVIIRNADSGEDDAGTVITMAWRTRAHDCGDFTALKSLVDLFIQAEPLAGKTIKVRFRVDGRQIEEQTVALDALSGEDILVKSLKALDTEQGRFLQFEFVNDELNAPIRIYQHGFLSIVHERQYTDP